VRERDQRCVGRFVKFQQMIETQNAVLKRDVIPLLRQNEFER
jgi:hypothetical protein